MHRDDHRRSRCVAGALLAAFCLVGLLAAAADPVAEALSAVRDNKRDMYDTTSSVLGTLDSPATLAALQLSCRPIPSYQPGHPPTLAFDAATTQRLVALAADFSAHLTKDRSRGRAVFPLTTTGAQIRDLIGSPASAVIHLVHATPAEHQLEVGDVIVGANGHLFSDSEDPRPELGSALSDSQGPELHGVLTLQVVRHQHPLNVAIALPTPMRYSATWPDDCPKTVAIRQASLANVLTEQGTQFDFWTPLYLLASGDDAALERARRYVYDYLHGENAREAVPSGNSWIISYHLLAICEYYQLTRDAEVLAEIAYSVRILERQQFASGGWSHGEPGGYGEINNVGIIALMALVQARDCGAPVSPIVLAKAIRYFGQWCGTNLPYGMGSPGARSGTVLIVVAGISALLSSMGLIFLMTVRDDDDDMAMLVRETQARIMLNAACSYIQEAARLGWEPVGNSTSEHAEASGWIDVRDGSMGPRSTTVTITAGQRAASQHPIDGDGQGTGNVPIGVPLRFPMHAMNQPPCAIQLTASYNPVQLGAPDNGQAFLRYPDPQPVTTNGWAADPANPAGAVTAAGFASWVAGDPTLRSNSFGMSWFRLVREATGAVFTLTCGCGASQGYRTWAEVVAAQATPLFNNDPAFFASLVCDELRLWYRVEWSPATTAIDLNYLHEYQEEFFAVATHTYSGGGAANPASYSGAMMAPNMGAAPSSGSSACARSPHSGEPPHLSADQRHPSRPPCPRSRPAPMVIPMPVDCPSAPLPLDVAAPPRPRSRWRCSVSWPPSGWPGWISRSPCISSPS
jgi:hypothetical protein